MNISQIEESLKLADAAIDFIKDVAIKDQEITKSKVRDHRYIHAILVLQQKRESIKISLDRAIDEQRT